MPMWVQVILTAAALTGALGVLWAKLVRPGLRMAQQAEEMLPLMLQLTEVFHGNPTAFAVLEDIAKEFRSDHGTTLRDVVNRLEQSGNDASAAAGVLKVNVETARLLAEEDRQKLALLIQMLQPLLSLVQASAQGIDRIEVDRISVAEELAASQQRADETEGDAGASADAAAGSGPTPSEAP